MVDVWVVDKHTIWAEVEDVLCNGTGSKYSIGTLFSLLYLEQDEAALRSSNTMTHSFVRLFTLLGCVQYLIRETGNGRVVRS